MRLKYETFSLEVVLFLVVSRSDVHLVLRFPGVIFECPIGQRVVIALLSPDIVEREKNFDKKNGSVKYNNISEYISNIYIYTNEIHQH